ncbi:MAG: MFS transporter, partial [Microbacteriaceae bacterium]
MARHPRPSGRLLAWRNSVFVVFGLSGLDLASWVARVPTVRDALQASTLQMGLLIFGLAGGSIVGLLVSSHLIARITARKAILWSLTAGPTGLIVAGVGATAGRSFALTFIGLAVFGLGAGLCDVAMNVSAAASERLLGRTIMPLYHACFSLGTVVGAALGALAETIRIPLGIHMAAIAVSTILAVALVAGRLQPEQSGHAEHGRTGPATGSADRPPTGTWRSRLGAWRDPGTLLIGVVVLGMAFAEGSANDWLALAMVDGHGVSNAGGALVFAVFVGSMTTGRIAGSRLL